MGNGNEKRKTYHRCGYLRKFYLRCLLNFQILKVDEKLEEESQLLPVLPVYFYIIIKNENISVKKVIYFLLLCFIGSASMSLILKIVVF